MQTTKYLLLSGLCFCPSGSINFTLSKYCGGSWFLLEELVGWEVGCNLLEISSSVANSHLALSIKYCTICVFWTRLCWRFSPFSFDRRRLGAQQMARFLLLIPRKVGVIHDILKSAISYWFLKLNPCTVFHLIYANEYIQIHLVAKGKTSKFSCW